MEGTQQIRTLEDGTHQVRVAFRIPGRPKLTHAQLSIFEGNIVLVEQDKPTTKMPVISLEEGLCA